MLLQLSADVPGRGIDGDYCIILVLEAARARSSQAVEVHYLYTQRAAIDETDSP